MLPNLLETNVAVTGDSVTTPSGGSPILAVTIYLRACIITDAANRRSAHCHDCQGGLPKGTGYLVSIGGPWDRTRAYICLPCAARRVELGQIDVLGDIGYKVQGDRCLEYKLGGPVSWVAVAETLESVR